jgi:hypothetical protein
VWRSCRHFLIHSLIIVSRIFSFRLEGNIRANNIIQCCSSGTILRCEVLFDILQGFWPIFAIDLWFLTLVVVITANQNQVDCIGNRLTLNPFHMFEIIYTKFQVSHCYDGDRYPIFTSSNSCSSAFCRHSPSRISDSFDGCIHVFNPIQICDFI